MRRSELEVVAQRRQVIGVLEHAALLRRSLARAMAPTIVRNHAKGLGERNDDRVPVVMVSPGAVYQHERLTRTAHFVVELYTIHTRDRHRTLSPRGRPAPRQSHTSDSGIVNRQPS